MCLHQELHSILGVTENIGNLCGNLIVSATEGLQFFEGISCGEKPKIHCWLLVAQWIQTSIYLLHIRLLLNHWRMLGRNSRK